MARRGGASTGDRGATTRALVHRGEGRGNRFQENGINDAVHSDEADSVEFDIFAREGEGYDNDGSDGDSDSDSEYLPSSSPARSLSSLADEDVLGLLDVPDIQKKLGELRKKLALANRCRCGVFRKVSVSFANEVSATLVWCVLMSEKYHFVNPLLVRDDERFEVPPNITPTSPAQNRSPSSSGKPNHMSADTCHTLPIDPYLLGMYFGDGCLCGVQIASSVPETLLTINGVFA